jgi:hypothetical protein
LTAVLADGDILSTLMVRNRKGVIGGFMPRRVSTLEVEMTPEERGLYGRCGATYAAVTVGRWPAMTGP